MSLILTKPHFSTSKVRVRGQREPREKVLTWHVANPGTTHALLGHDQSTELGYSLRALSGTQHAPSLGYSTHTASKITLKSEVDGRNTRFLRWEAGAGADEGPQPCRGAVALC